MTEPIQRIVCEWCQTQYLPEAGVPVGFHLSDSGYLQIAGMWGGRSTFEAFGGSEPLEQILTDDRAIHDAVQVIGYFNYITRVADALGVEREDFIPPWGVTSD